MAYSIIEQELRDLDIFFKDNKKCIFLTSAGGRIPNILADNDISNEDFSSTVLSLEELYEVEINNNLVELLNLENETAYLEDFLLMAKRGFYCYDKTNLGNFSDTMFHLVAKPKNADKLFKSSKTENLLTISLSELPINYTPFNLFELMEIN